MCPSVQLLPQGSSETSDFAPCPPVLQRYCGLVHRGTVHNYVVLSELCSCRSLLSLVTATLLGKCSSFTRSRCPAQVSLLALILATMPTDGTKYSSLISLSVYLRLQSSHISSCCLTCILSSIMQFICINHHKFNLPVGA